MRSILNGMDHWKHIVVVSHKWHVIIQKKKSCLAICLYRCDVGDGKHIKGKKGFTLEEDFLIVRSWDAWLEAFRSEITYKNVCYIALCICTMFFTSSFFVLCGSWFVFYKTFSVYKRGSNYCGVLFFRAYMVLRINACSFVWFSICYCCCWWWWFV